MWEDDRDQRDWPETSAEVEGSQGRPDWNLKRSTGKGLRENRRLGAPTDRPGGSSQQGSLIKEGSGQLIAEGLSQQGPFIGGAPGKAPLRNDRARNRRHQKSQLKRPCGKIAENRCETYGHRDHCSVLVAHHLGWLRVTPRSCGSKLWDCQDIGRLRDC